MAKYMHKQSLSRIGVTLGEYKSQGDFQDWKCAICESKTDEKLCADHNHSNGKFRGLLCQRCNRSLGLLRDSINILKKAIQYLENDGVEKCQKIYQE